MKLSSVILLFLCAVTTCRGQKASRNEPLKVFSCVKLLSKAINDKNEAAAMLHVDPDTWVYRRPHKVGKAEQQWTVLKNGTYFKLQNHKNQQCLCFKRGSDVQFDYIGTCRCDGVDWWAQNWESSRELDGNVFKTPGQKSYMSVCRMYDCISVQPYKDYWQVKKC